MTSPKIPILFLFITTLCHSKEPSAITDLYEGDAPGLVAGGNAEEIVNERIRNVSKPQMFVWFPENRPANGTAMIICPGGGYGHLALKLHAGSIIDLLNGKGITVIALKYRTRYGNNDVAADALADGERAVRIVRSKAKEWQLNPNRIGIQGYSAGANLCLNLEGNFDEGDPKSADPIERLSSRPDFVALMCPWPNGKKLDAYPLGKDAPPTFIAHAKDDASAPFAFGEGIIEKLEGLGVAHEFFVVESGGHSAFHYGATKSPGANWPEVFLPWLVSIGKLE